MKSMKSLQKNGLWILRIMVLVVGILLFANGRANAYMCPGATCDTGMMFCQVDCNTYTETIHIDPTLPAQAATYTESLGTTTLNNCTNNNAATLSTSWNYSSSEQLAHSCSGSLTSSVGVQVGDDSVGRLSLSHAITLSNGWQKQDTYTESRTDTVTAQVPACSSKAVTWSRSYLCGNFSSSAYRQWTCQIRQVCYVGNWASGYGECQYTTSSASGSNRLYSNVTSSISNVTCQGGCTKE
jgi:hypothetical protein